MNVGFSLILDIRHSNLNLGFSLIFDIQHSKLNVEYRTSNQSQDGIRISEYLKFNLYMHMSYKWNSEKYRNLFAYINYSKAKKDINKLAYRFLNILMISIIQIIDIHK